MATSAKNLQHYNNGEDWTEPEQWRSYFVKKTSITPK